MRAWLSFRGSGLNTEPTGGKGFASQSRASMLSQLDVFTIDEIARAAGVPRAAVQRLVDSGELKSVAGSGFFDTRAAVLAGIKARREAALTADSQVSTLPLAANRREERGLSAVVSSLLHGALLALLIWSTSGAVDMAAKVPHDRLIFLAGPGPGGGGGGGGKAPRARSIASSVRDHKHRHPSNPNLNHFHREHLSHQSHWWRATISLFRPNPRGRVREPALAWTTGLEAAPVAAHTGREAESSRLDSCARSRRNTPRRREHAESQVTSFWKS
jgi:putative AbiEi antitoxin of type IV toxin-antitoxin system